LSSIPVEKLLEPISADAPSGPNLEYDPAFVEMERLAQGTPEQQYGSTIIEAKEPEWSDVQRSALELLERTHDLRVGLYLVRAALGTEGLPAVRDALALLRGFVDTFWESVHPQLDPDDDNDPSTRVNTLAGLCDNATVLSRLRKMPIVSSRAIGRFSRLDVAQATGEVAYVGPPDSKPKISLIDAAFQDIPLEQLRESTQAATDSVEQVRALEKSMTSLVGAGNMRSLDPFVKELDGIRKILSERLSRRGASLSAAAAAPEATASTAAPGGSPSYEAASAPAPANGMQHAAPPWTGEITSRSHAIRAIEHVCRYFERYEPSSPLPLLLHRAVRLSTKSFLEILRDISPDGLTQAETLGGMSSEEYSSQIAAAAQQAADSEAARAPARPTPPPSPPIDEY